MVCVPYFATLLLLFALPLHVLSANIISLYDNVSDDFKFINEKSSFQDMRPIKVFLYIYENKHTGWCMQVLSFNLIWTEDAIDFFMVSCDVKGPFKMEKGMIIIEDIGYLGIREQYPIWGLYVMQQGYCVQRRYTDHDWNFLEEIEEMDLNMEQCGRVIKSGRALKAAVSKDDVTELSADKIPKIGETNARIISMDDSFVDEYDRDDSKHDDREGEGDVAKMTVYHLKHEKTGECARFVSINSIYTEDFLDFIVITCEEGKTDNIIINNDMITYADLVYVRDHAHDPIWAIFVMKNEDCKTGVCEMYCVLKVYTDVEHFKLLPRNHNTLTWKACLNLMNHKDIKGFWSTEGIKETLDTVSRTYEEVVEMLEVDLAPDSTPVMSSSLEEAESEKPEGPGYLAVPQPEPKAPLVKQQIEAEEESDNRDHSKQSSPRPVSRPASSTASPAAPPTLTRPSPPPPKQATPPEEGGLFGKKVGNFFGGAKLFGAAENFGLVTKQMSAYIPADIDDARKKFEEQKQKLTQQFQQAAA